MHVRSGVALALYRHCGLKLLELVPDGHNKRILRGYLTGVPTDSRRAVRLVELLENEGRRKDCSRVDQCWDGGSALKEGLTMHARWTAIQQ